SPNRRVILRSPERSRVAAPLGPAHARPLIPDTPATTTLRQTCRARQDLVRHRVAVTNQLRAHLLSAFPSAAGLFRGPGLADQPGLSGPLRLPGPRGLAVGETAGYLAERRQLQRPH